MPSQGKAQLESANLDPIDGGSLVYFVKNLSGTTPEVMLQACSAAGIPQRDSGFGPGLKVTGGPRVIRMAGNFAAFVEVTITKGETPSPGGGSPLLAMTLDTRLVTEVTTLDTFGRPIRVRFKPGGITQNNPDGTPAPSTEYPPQGGEVQKQVPLTVLRVTKAEPWFPIRRAQLYPGKTNADTFFLFPAEYWLCGGVLTESANRDVRPPWNTTYEFWGQPFGWLQAVTYRNETGQLMPVSPSPVINGNPPRLRLQDQPPGDFGVGVVQNGPDQDMFSGMTLVRVQGSTSFASLNIQPPAATDPAP